jgi:hypothetical protein
MAELWVAIETGDASAVERVSHTITGVASNFAAPAVVDPARRLQAMGKAGELAEAEAAGIELGVAVDRFREAAGASRAGSRIKAS